MDADVERGLVQRVLDHIATDTRDLAPAVTRRHTGEYLDPVRFAEEQQALFRDHPVVVGHTAQLPEPGSFFTHDHSGVPIVVTRGADGELRAFLNVCRHRGARAAAEPCGTARRLTCRFHGWTYDLEGRLRGLPQPEGFDGLDRDGLGLVALPLAHRHGLIFVRPRAGGAAIDLDHLLGAIDAEVAEHHPERYVLTLRSWEVACNWKVLLDNFLEMYHVPVLHGSNIGPMFEPNRSLYDAMGANGRRIDPRTSIRRLADRPPASWRLRDHALITYHLFPNLQTFWTQDYFSWLQVWPLAIDRTVCVQFIAADWRPEDGDTERDHLQTNLDLFDQTLAEDFGVSEEIQRGLGSGANEVVLFGRFEQEAAGVHAAADAALARWRAGQRPEGP
ncbi:MAG: aromatic ring-hydroxylating dioxygenase subunit alpha [Acidimicrobiia bacterium]